MSMHHSNVVSPPQGAHACKSILILSLIWTLLCPFCHVSWLYCTGYAGVYVSNVLHTIRDNTMVRKTCMVNSTKL